MRRTTPTPVKMSHHPLKQRWREGFLIICSGLALFFLLALVTYHPTLTTSHLANAGGRVGFWVAKIFFYLFGYLAYLFPPMLVYFAWLGLGKHQEIPDSHLPSTGLRSLGFVLALCASCGFASLHGTSNFLAMSAGGILGKTIARGLVASFSFYSAALLLLAFSLSGITLATGFSWLKFMDKTGHWTLLVCGLLKERWSLLGPKLATASTPDIATKPEVKVEIKNAGKRVLPRVEPEIHRQELPKPPVRQIPLPLRSAPVTGILPSLELLDPAEKPTGKQYTNEELEKLSEKSNYGC